MSKRALCVFLNLIFALCLSSCGGGGGGGGSGSTSASAGASSTGSGASGSTTTGGSASAAGTAGESLNAKLGKPNRFLVGLGAGNVVADMNSQSIRPDIFDQYLVGVGSGSWPYWNSPNGAFITIFAQQAESVGATPMFTLYQMAQNGDGNLSGLNDSTFMTNYWAQAKLMFQILGTYNKPVLVNLEPDFWGYVKQQATGGDPANLFAHVSLQPECAKLANNAIGVAQCLLTLGRAYAPKALIGYPPSFFGWTASQVAAEMNELGAQNADFIVAQTSDRDAGCMEVTTPPPECAGRGAGPFYWDESNKTTPNFEQSLSTWSAMHDSMKNLPIVWWQTPMGVPSATPGGTTNHYRDDHVDYMLKNASQYTAIGSVAAVFSAGASSQTTIATDGGQFKNLFSQYLSSPASLP